MLLFFVCVCGGGGGGGEAGFVRNYRGLGVCAVNHVIPIFKSAFCDDIGKKKNLNKENKYCLKKVIGSTAPNLASNDSVMGVPAALKR